MGDAEGFLPLKHEIICDSLSLIERTVAGSGYAFTKLDCSEKGLTDLGNKIQEYKNLKYVTISKNAITDLAPVSQLPHVLHLAATENKITKEGLECMLSAELPWCQHLDLSANALVGVVSLMALGRLRVLDLQKNEIASLESFDGHQNIEVLKLQENKLESLKGLGTLPKLKKLFVGQNALTSLEGLDAENLEVLDAPGNQLASLNFIEGAPALKSLNISGNQLAAGEGEDQLPEISKLNSKLQYLESINAEGNPMCGTLPDARKEILLVLPRILKILPANETPDGPDAESVEKKERDEVERLKKIRAEENANALKNALKRQIDDLKDQLPEDVQATITAQEEADKATVEEEFPPPPEPVEAEEGAAEDEAPKEVEKPDPMPKLEREVKLLKALLEMVEKEAEKAGIGKEEAPAEGEGEE